MSTGNKWNYLFPLSFHSVLCSVIISSYTKIFSQLLWYNFSKCWGNSCISKVSVLLWSVFISVNHQMYGQEFWVWDCQSSPHHIWASAPRCRCGLHTWMGGKSRYSACSRDVLPTVTSSIGSPADCELQPELPEHETASSVQACMG